MSLRRLSSSIVNKQFALLQASQVEQAAQKLQFENQVSEEIFLVKLIG